MADRPAHGGMMLRVLALDLSLTGTGWATSEMRRLTGRTLGVIDTSKLRGAERLGHIRDWISGTLTTERIDLVVLENYAYARANQAHQLGELGGVVRLLLFDHNLPHVVVPPAVLKKYATGKGNAGKSEVLVAAVRRLSYAGSDDNEADALWLRTMALDHYGELPEPVVPKAQREVLAKIDWPNLRREAAA